MEEHDRGTYRFSAPHRGLYGAIAASALAMLSPVLKGLFRPKSPHGLILVSVGMLLRGELLPTAFKYDSKDSIVTRCFVAGMAIMALSLVLFLNV